MSVSLLLVTRCNLVLQIDHHDGNVINYLSLHVARLQVSKVFRGNTRISCRLLDRFLQQCADYLLSLMLIILLLFVLVELFVNYLGCIFLLNVVPEAISTHYDEFILRG